MLTKTAMLILVHLLNFSSIYSLPNGSPLCEADAEKVSGCMGGENQESYKYVLNCGDCKVKPGEKLIFKLSALVPNYHGLLLYAQGPDPKDRVGSFKINDLLYKNNEKRCKRYNYQKDSVLTHKDNSEKAANTEFEWTAPKPCPATIQMRGAFVYNRLSNWMVLKPVDIKCDNSKEENVFSATSILLQRRAFSSTPTPIMYSTPQSTQSFNMTQSNYRKVI